MKATKTPAVTETIVVTPGGVTLTLSDEEASLLNSFLYSHVYFHDGSKVGTLAGDIHTALDKADVELHYTKFYKGALGMSVYVDGRRYEKAETTANNIA